MTQPQGPGVGSSNTVTVKLSGPLFDHPSATIDKILGIAEHSIKQLVEMGHEHLGEMLRPRPNGVYLSISEGGRSTGHYRRSIHDEVQSLHGRIDDSRVVYGPWLEGTGSRNSGRFPGYASFRRTRDWLETRAQDVLEGWATRTIRRLT